jgi:hypothetical protein
MLPAGSAFKEDVRSALRYVETVTYSKYHYEGVLIDEERIFGIESTSVSVCRCIKTILRFRVDQPKTMDLEFRLSMFTS